MPPKNMSLESEFWDGNIYLLRVDVKKEVKSTKR